MPKKKKNIDWKNSIGYKVKFIYDDIQGEVEIIRFYINKDSKNRSRSYLDIKYNNHVVSILTTLFKSCTFGELLGKKTKNYRYKINDIINVNTGKIQILEKIRNKDNNKAYKYRCLNCGNEDEIRESSLDRNYGCNVCCNPPQKVLKGYNDLWTTHPNIARLLKDSNKGHEISFGSGNSEIFVCSDCGYEREYIISRITRYGFTCKKCGDKISYPNKFMFNFLEQLNMDFIPEYSPDWIKPKRYDFYFELDNKGYIVEMDGAFHTRDNKLNGISKQQTQELDKFKDDVAKSNNLKVIRIDCQISDFTYIKNNILKSELSEILNIEYIDWVRCHKFACSTRIKEACIMWNDNNTVSQISNIIKLNRNTVIRHLYKGKEIGWCDYDGRKAQKEGAKVNSKLLAKYGGLNKRKVVQLTTEGVLVNKWDSIKEASFNTNTNQSGINSCCTGRYDLSNGFIWMYLEDYENCIINNIDIFYKKPDFPYNFIDIRGQQFGKLYVLKNEEPIKKSNQIHFLCQCDCGSEPKYIESYYIRTGHTQSCGCLKNKMITIDGITKNITQWAKECGFSDTTIRSRLKLGKTGKDLILPAKNKKNNVKGAI